MRPQHGDLEIVIKVKRNGDFTVESNSREKFRVLRALSMVAKEMVLEMNRLNGALLSPSDHVGRFERTA